MSKGELEQPRGRAGSVQSVARAFELLETMADHGGMAGLSQLAAESGLPLPTIHRLIRTLVDLGYVRQDRSRRYVLGPKLIHLGESSTRMLKRWARPHLERLVDALGESANLAMLDGDQIVYVAQAQSHHSMRMFTEVGRRVLPHCTAVGKAVLAEMDRADVEQLLRRTGMPKRTENTVTDLGELMGMLERSEQLGYALDEGEQEVGVRCVAVAVPGLPTPMAISVSGPAPRMTDDLVQRAVPLISDVAAALSRELS